MAGNTYKGSYPPDHPVYQQTSTIGIVKLAKDEPKKKRKKSPTPPESDEENLEPEE